MRIAIYYPWVYLRSGIERMMLELIKRSRHDWVIFTSHYYPDQTYPEFREMDIVELSKVSVNRRFSAVSNAALTILRQKIDLETFDALVVSSEGLGDLITFRNHEVAVICYCHTPMKVIHDAYSRRVYLDEHRKTAPAFHMFAAMFKLIDRMAWKHYSYIFCNSEEVRRRIIKANLASSEKIEVLPPGLDVERMKLSDDYQKYFVVISRMKWWKNFELAIESFIEFKDRYPRFADFQLQVVGQVEPRSEEYFNRLQGMASGRDDIIFKRDPTEAVLMDAYSSSYGLVYPSLNEDWGMVPLEAMGFGKPVIAVNQGGPSESVVNGVTGYLVSPDPSEFAEKMALLADDEELTRRLGKAGSDHVEKYDWSHFVARFDEFLDSIN